MLFNITVSDHSYQTKPTKSDYKTMQLQTREVDVETLADLIRSGYSICSEFNLNHLSLKEKTNQNFKQSNLIILDFDDAVIELEDILNCVRIKPTIAFKTYSNTDTDYRFKLIYLFEEPIKSVSEFKRKSMLMLYLLFNQREFDLINPSFDSSSYSPVQLCNGTNQEVRLFDTVISLDSINQLFEFIEEPFNTFEEVFDLIGINVIENTELTEVSQTKKSEENIKNNTDFFCFPSMGHPYEIINNSYYFIKNPFNNYHTAMIDDSYYNDVYFYVGDQYIYSLTTFFTNGKIGDNRRHKTLLYAALVIRNIYPDSDEQVLFNALLRYVNSYFVDPRKMDHATIWRMVRKVISNRYVNTAGKRYYLLNPRFSYLTKKEKLSELQKIRARRTRDMVLNSYDFNLSLKENASNIGLSIKTIKKYMLIEGICLFNKSGVGTYDRFLSVYQIEENQNLSVRKLAEKSGVSKSQVQRFIKLLKG